MKTLIEIDHFTDNNGDQLVRVPLIKSDLKATLLEEDFNDLMALGISAKWKLCHGQVITRNSHREVSIARLIRHAKASQRVIRRDGDPLNLKRSNLIIAPGPSKYEARNNIARALMDTTLVEHNYN